MRHLLVAALYEYSSWFILYRYVGIHIKHQRNEWKERGREEARARTNNDAPVRTVPDAH